MKKKGVRRGKYEPAPAWALSEEEKAGRTIERVHREIVLRDKDEWARRYAEEKTEKYTLKEEEPL